MRELSIVASRANRLARGQRNWRNMSFANLGLNELLNRSISDQGYEKPTPIQEKAIPEILAGRDVLAAAQTGTGKTASFTLPMLDLLSKHANTSVSPAKHPIRALILAPTRELAAQVEESAKTYSKYLPLRVGSVFGGVPMDPQTTMLRSGIEILVATPGRLLDHIQMKAIRFTAVEFLVLDEADRMLDMGFLPDIKRIIDLLPQKRQTLMFSATYSDEIRSLASKWLNDPVKVEVAPRNTITETIEHTVYKVDEFSKRDRLVDLIAMRDMKQVLIFCNTKIGANRLSSYLDRKGFSAQAIHSDRTQIERMDALAKFKANEINFLVATDIAARGIDIEDLPFVINFDLPPNPEDYVHRIGRTGRAGQKGEAISFASNEDGECLSNIEKLIKVKLQSKSSLTRPTSIRKLSSTKNSEDPFFDKPYVPTAKSDELKKQGVKKASSAGVEKAKNSNKPVAALFMPRSSAGGK